MWRRLRRLGRLGAQQRRHEGEKQKGAAHGASVAWQLVFLWVLALGCAPAPTVPAPRPPIYVEPEEPPSPSCERITRIEVYKQAHQLLAYCEGGPVRRMSAAIGRESGHKQGEGDQRTPEGSYRIIGPLENSRFHGFIPIDYPSLADADAALAARRITRRDRARIAAAHAHGVQPPVDTPLGGDIGIHGEGPRWSGDSLHMDWTYGCIAVTDADLDFLASRVAAGVPIEILR